MSSKQWEVWAGEEERNLGWRYGFNSVEGTWPYWWAWLPSEPVRKADQEGAWRTGCRKDRGSRGREEMKTPQREKKKTEGPLNNTLRHLCSCYCALLIAPRHKGGWKEGGHWQHGGQESSGTGVGRSPKTTFTISLQLTGFSLCEMTVVS